MVNILVTLWLIRPHMSYEGWKDEGYVSGVEGKVWNTAGLLVSHWSSRA